ncbi:uncharacterized protein LOC126554715, partial [Aphis gossypii]|uniref:uncharacterized protein LOC126554715 n=1 Tax=Aphis gossypii TaxID=80765 RepID=UPI002158DB83
ICEEKDLKTYVKLREHLTYCHGLEIEYEEKHFGDISEFEKWKQDLEQHTSSMYTLDRATSQLRDGNLRNYYYCHRSYNYRSQGNDIRHVKSMGSNKIGKACPAMLKVTISNSDKTVFTQFWKTHCGHVEEIGRIRLDHMTRTLIAGKLEEGVTLTHILDSIRESEMSSDALKRSCLLERQDLYNITRDFNINYATKRDTNDAVSVELWVTEMLSYGEDCPVLYYKNQGANDSILDSEDFDEFGSGCPVAFCFSNRSDERIFQLFFDVVKSKVGQIQSIVFMSDDAPAFYNAWVNVMGPATHKLLCTWHIDRNWRQNLNKITGGHEKKALDLLDDPNTNTFGLYFERHYASRPECWAYC